MIFDNNSTALGAMNIPVPDGYDSQTGTARALIESARNDYAMFKAMLSVDSRECQIQQESAGYVMEGEVTSLAEAAVGGIWQKIVDLFKKLIAKIKSIFSNFIARITGLVAKDKTLVRKYKKQILAKGSAINKMEIKFSKVKVDPLSTPISVKTPSLSELLGMYKEDRNDMIEEILGDSDTTQWRKDYHEQFFEDEETGELSDFDLSGAKLVQYLDNYGTRSKNINKALNELEKAVNKIVKEADKKATEAAKNVKADDDSTTKAVDDANHTYQAALVFQECISIASKALLDEIAFDYKQHKAASMKAVTVNGKKLKENAEYYDAVAEAAAQEVDDVINGAISKEELSQFNAASKNILDGDASDDPYANEYDKCSYYSNSPDYKVDGSIDSCINSRCGCKESYDFGAPLY